MIDKIFQANLLFFCFFFGRYRLQETSLPNVNMTERVAELQKARMRACVMSTADFLLKWIPKESPGFRRFKLQF